MIYSIFNKEGSQNFNNPIYVVILNATIATLKGSNDPMNRNMYGSGMRCVNTIAYNITEKYY